MVIYVYNVNKQEGENLVSCKNLCSNLLYMYIYTIKYVQIKSINKKFFERFHILLPLKNFWIRGQDLLKCVVTFPLLGG